MVAKRSFRSRSTKRGFRHQGSTISSAKQKNIEYVYGINPVSLALEANRRRLINLYINNQKETDSSSYNKIVSLAEKLNLSVIKTNDLDEMLPGKPHQGFILEAGLLPTIGAGQLTVSASKWQKIVAIDQVQDTQNIGAIIRSASYFGCDALITTENHAAPLNATASKSSAGLMELMKIVKVANLSQILIKLKKVGFWIIGASLKGSNLYDFEVPDRYVLVLGNENQGLRRLVASQCDWLLNIPGELNHESLNVSVAGGIFLSQLNHKQSIK